MKKILKAGLTDQTIDIFVQDSSSATGAGLTGLVFNSAGLVCYYRRGATGSATALTLATQTVGGAHSDGGFVEISSANMPGMYRLDLSDAIVATGVTTVTLMLKGATNMAPVTIELQLVSVDVDDATSFGLSRIDAAITSRSSHSAADVWTSGTRTLSAFDSSFKTGYALSSAGVQAIWDALTSALTTAGSIGKLLVDNVNATISSRSSHSAADVWTSTTRTLSAFSTSLAVSVWDVLESAIGTASSIGMKLKTFTFTGSDVRATLDGETVALTAGQITVKKNTALNNFEFVMVDSTDHVTGKTGLTVTAQRSIDGAAFANAANSVTEIANGVYKISLAAADLNGDVIMLKFTATGADTTFIEILTQA